MSGQVIHVHNYADGPPAVKSAPVQLTDAERKAGLRSLVAGSAVVKGLAKPLRGGMRIAAKATGDESSRMQAVVSGPTSDIAQIIQMALRGEDLTMLVSNGSIGADDARAISGTIDARYVAKCQTIDRLEKNVQSGASRMTETTLAAACEEITAFRLERQEIAKQLARIIQKGLAQQALNGTATPSLGPASDMARMMSGQSGLAGNVVTGMKMPPTDSALTLGGESPFATKYDAPTRTNPATPRTLDGAGIVNPQAEKLAKACAELDTEQDPNRRARLGELVTALRMGHSGIGLAA